MLRDSEEQQITPVRRELSTVHEEASEDLESLLSERRKDSTLGLIAQCCVIAAALISLMCLANTFENGNLETDCGQGWCKDGAGWVSFPAMNISAKPTKKLLVFVSGGVSAKTYTSRLHVLQASAEQHGIDISIALLSVQGGGGSSNPATAAKIFAHAFNSRPKNMSACDDHEKGENSSKCIDSLFVAAIGFSGVHLAALIDASMQVSHGFVLVDSNLESAGRGTAHEMAIPTLQVGGPSYLCACMRVRMRMHACVSLQAVCACLRAYVRA
jgi:hypothetical protein